MSESPKINKDNKTWLLGLQEFLYNEVLPLADSNGKTRLQLVDQEAMHIWETAFTHISINSNLGYNYEELEKLGDAVMGELYITYIYRTVKNINKSDLSELKSYYVSKEIQGTLSKKLKLQEWLRTKVNKTNNILEDLLEAFFGALKLIGDQKFGIGVGYILTFNLLVNLYKDVPIDYDILKGSFKNQVKTITDKMGWIRNRNDRDPLEEEWIQDNEPGSKSGTLILRLPQPIINYLDKISSIKLHNNIIACVKSKSKNVAIAPAYKIALQNLASLGITRELANSQQTEKLFNSINSEYSNKVLENLKKQGYTFKEIKLAQSGNNGSHVQLIGVDKNNIEKILEEVTEPNINDAKKKVLEKYAQKNI